MAEQLSLLQDDVPSLEGGARPRPSSVSSYPLHAAVVVDIPSRSLSDPFAYGVPEHIACDIECGCTVLVPFGRRVALGYVIDLAETLEDLSFSDGVAASRLKAVRSIVAEPSCASYFAEMSLWMSGEYVSSLAECLRLFLPPGGTPRLKRRGDGTYEVEPAAVAEARERVVSLTIEGNDYVPPANAVRQRQLLSALSCGPVTTRELNVLYTLSLIHI